MKFASHPFPDRRLPELLRSAQWAYRFAWSEHRILILGLSCLTLLRGLLPAGFALVIRELINSAVRSVNHPNDAVPSLLPWFLLGLALTILDVAFHLFYQFLNRRLADEMDLTITTKILNHAAGLDVAFFEDSRSQDMIHRARQNSSGHFSRFLANTLGFVTQSVQILSLIVVLIAIEPLILAALIPVALIHFLFQWRLSNLHYLLEYNRTRKRRWSHYFLSLLTSAKLLPEVKLLGLSPLMINKSSSLLSEFRDENRGKHMRSFTGGFLIQTFSAIAFYGVLINVLRRFLAGLITVGDLAVFGTVGLRLRSSLESAVLSISSVLEQALFVSNLREFLQLKPEWDSGSSAEEVYIKGEIEVRNVSFAYSDSSQPVLSNISLRIQPGEIVAIVGANGSGKTTLVKLIARIYRPDVGSILYDGKDLSDLPDDLVYQGIAFVFQNHVPFEATAWENIAYGDWKRLLHDRDAVEEIARTSNASRIIEKMPQGYSTLLGRRFGKHDLSAGQWQQMAIGRAFARNASILIFDEPASNLDAKAEYQLFDRFRRLAKGRTTILISHRLSTVRLADRILVLENGQITESGTHEQLLAENGHYANLYRKSGQLELLPDLEL